jgi:hypothetical protein
MVGRGTRVHPGKADLLVLDLVGATSRHDLQTAAQLFGVPARRLEEGASVTEAVAAERRAVEAARAAAEGRRIARDVDPFHRKRLAWTAAPSGAYSLPLGDGTLFLVPRASERWDVHLVRRDRSVQTLASGLSLPYAQGFAEDHARRQGAASLIRSDASWRARPASDKQRALLERWGQWREGLTAGEASDVIAARVARAAGRTLTYGTPQGAY